MIEKWIGLRLLATFKRLVAAMEEANRLERHRQELEYPPIPKADAPTRKTVITYPTPADWNT